MIHKSNKILDGKLIDIKRAHRSNTYEIGLLAGDQSKVAAQLEAKFETTPATFKTINDELQYRIKIAPNESPNNLLTFLTTLGEVTHFEEVVPSANDIFIQTVKNN